MLFLLVFIFVFAAAEDLLQEVLLFLRCGRLRRIGSVAVWRSVGCGGRRERRLQVAAWCCWWSAGLIAADAEDLLDEVLRIFTHLAAGIHGRGAIEEGDVEAVARAG